MNFAKFAETLLVRDFLSYLVPGGLIVLILLGFRLDGGIAASLSQLLSPIGGDWVKAVVVGALCYVTGYLASTLLFYLRGWIRPFRRPQPQDPAPEVVERLVKIFGPWVSKEPPSRAVALGLHYVEVAKPDHYFEKIERRVVLRNFEVSLAAVLITLAVALVLSLSGWQLLFGFVPLIGAILLLLSSRNLESSIDRIGVIAFLAVTSLLSSQGTSPIADEGGGKAKE